MMIPAHADRIPPERKGATPDPARLGRTYRTPRKLLYCTAATRSKLHTAEDGRSNCGPRRPSMVAIRVSPLKRRRAIYS